MIEISVHQIRLYRWLRSQDRWVTARDAAEGAEIAGRTARAHLLKWAKEGIVEQANVFPGHRYRLHPMASNRDEVLLGRLEKAAAVFSI